MIITAKDLYDMCLLLKKEGLNLKDIPVYLGDDEELNGIHCSFYITKVNKHSKDEDIKYLSDMIKDYEYNKDVSDVSLLIS